MRALSEMGARCHGHSVSAVRVRYVLYVSRNHILICPPPQPQRGVLSCSPLMMEGTGNHGNRLQKKCRSHVT